MRSPIKFRDAVIFLMLVFSIAVLGPGQTRVDNPGRALAKNAGRFIDNLVLRYPAGGLNHRGVARWTLFTDDGFFIIPEQEVDGLVSIGKYRIVDADLFPAAPGPKRWPSCIESGNKGAARIPAREGG